MKLFKIKNKKFTDLAKTKFAKTAKLLVIASFIFSILFSTILFSNTSVAHAAFNEEINYQGKLTDSSNDAVTDGSYNMEFNLYMSSSGGSPIWTEDWLVGSSQGVPVANGLFSTMLGTHSSLSGINFDQTLYLGVKIGSTGSTPTWDAEMTPRKIIGAVPAAFVANNADNLNNLNSSEFFRSDAANSTSTTATYFSITNSGTGDIADLIGQSGLHALTVLSNGNVGIGTTTPASSLDIYKSQGLATQIQLYNPDTNPSAGDELQFGNDTAQNGLVFGLSSSDSSFVSNAGYFYNREAGPMIFGTNNTERMRIDSSGNVGIGTTNPAAALDIVTPSDEIGLKISNPTAATYTQMELNGTGHAYNVGVGNASESSLGLANKYYVYDNTVGAIRMVIDSSGNVGIGTTTPQQKLTVNGYGSFSDGTQGLLVGAYSGGGGYGVIYPYGVTPGSSNYVFAANPALDTTVNSLSGNINLAIGGVTKLRVLSNGNVGIGSSSPTYGLTVTGSGAGFPGGSIVEVNNTSSTGGSRFYAINDQGKGASFNMYGSSFGVAGLNGNAGFGSDTGILVYSDAGVTSGGSDDINFSAGGYQNNVMTISHTGKVGIGTTSPVSLLSLSTAANATALTIMNTGNSGNAALGDIGVTATGQNSFATGYVASGGSLSATGAGSFATGYVVGGGLISSTNEGSFAGGLSAVSSSNSVTSSGLGSIAYGLAAGGSITSSGNGSIAFGYTSSGPIIASGIGSFAGGYSLTGTTTASATGAFAFGSNASATGQSSTAIGLNVSATGTLSTAFGTGFTNNVADSFMVGYSATPTFIVNGSNIGIGTTSPSQALSVNGNGYFTGTVTANGISNLGPSTATYFTATSPTATSTFAGGVVINGYCLTEDTKIRRLKKKRKTESKAGGNGNGGFGIAGEENNSGENTEDDSIVAGEEVWEDVSIFDLEEGDIIYSLDQKNNKIVQEKLIAVVATGIRPIVEITLEDGKSVKTTAEHPYLLRIRENDLIKDGRWTPAEHIRIDDHIAAVSANSMCAEWKKVIQTATHDRRDVYDLQIERTHNFVANGIIAHNTLIVNGNEGIGTTSPSSLLSVAGNAYITGVLTVDNPTNGSVSVGNNNTASSNWSSALGVCETSSGFYSSAVGYKNVASANWSSAIGSRNTACANGASAVGESNTASCYGASAFGRRNTASGYYTTASGYKNIACIYGASALGFCNTASGAFSAAIGGKNRSSQQYSSASGYNNAASSTSSSAFGYENLTCGCFASAFGTENCSCGFVSSAFGVSNITCGCFASAFGFTNTASSTGASAFGSENTASANYASAFGSHIINNIANSTMVGPSNTAKLTILSNGNVGIGTTTPTAELSVYQNTNSDLSINVQNAYSGKGSYISNQGNSNYVGDLLTGSSNTWGFGLWGSTNFSIVDNTTIGTIPFSIESSAPANSFYINNSGNVGIGTTTPQQKLTVNGYGSFSDGTQGLIMGAYTGGNGVGVIYPYGVTPGSSNYVFASDGSFDSINAPTGPIYLNAGGSTRMYITASGNVGIGTTNPSSPLQISNSGGLKLDLTGGGGSGQNGMQFESAGGSDIFYLYTGNQSPNNSGNFGIYDSTANKQDITILNNGNVGIGTTSPSQALSVNGNAYITGHLSSDNGAFHSDGSGNVTATSFSGDGSSLSGYASGFCVNYSSSSGYSTNSGSAYHSYCAYSSTNSDYASLSGESSSARDNLGNFFTCSGYCLDAGNNPLYNISTLSVNSSTAPTGGVAYFNGNVGIGTSSPTSNLSISGTGSGSINVLSASGNATSGNGVNVDFRNTNATNNKVQFILGGGTPGTNYNRVWSFGTDPGGTGAQQFFIYDGNSTKTPFTINSSDNIGIGTTNPTNPLDVEGTATSGSLLKVGSFQFQPYALNNAFIGENTYYNGSNFVYNQTGSAGLFYFLGNEGQFRFATCGTAGTVASAFNNAQLKINADGTFAVGSSVCSNNGCYTGANFIVTSTGNVGIGTTSPSSLLTVAGNACITGTLGLQQPSTCALIIGDTSGNARGSCALDVQSFRYAATQVASSYHSTAIGTANTAAAAASTASGYHNTTCSANYGGRASAFGANNTASGNYSSAFGYANTASGYWNPAAFGSCNVASCQYASAFGVCNNASNINSSAFGYRNTASGYYSSASGYYNTASGCHSSAFGLRNAASALNSQEFGSYNFSGTGGLAGVGLGILNNSTGATLNTSTGAITGTITATSTIGALSTAVGICNLTQGNLSTAVGYGNTAAGANSIALGYMNNTTPFCGYSTILGNTAVGYCNTAIGNKVMGSTPVPATAFGICNVACAGYSSAIGFCNNSGSGAYSSVFGYRNCGGAYSSAFGFQNNACIAYSYAFGGNNIACNNFSSAFGTSNKASGATSSAFGACNIASSTDSSVFGFCNTASGNYTTASGFKNIACALNSQLFGNQNFSGTGGLAGVGIGILNNASGACLCLTTGAISGTITATSTIGSFSTAVGICNLTQGALSNAFGYCDVALNTRSSAFGYNNIASGSYSSAVGYCNSASNIGSSASGYKDIASGNSSSAFGYNSTASNGATTASGYKNTASGSYSSAFGYCNTASGYGSSGLGFRNLACAYCASASGYNNFACGNGSSAFGYFNTASGIGSNAFGYKNTASSCASSVFGYLNTTCSAYKFSVAVGTCNTACGGSSLSGSNPDVALGYCNQSTASGYYGGYSAAVGLRNTASGTYSSAFGFANTACGNYSSAFGLANTACGNYSSAFGYQNISSACYASAFGSNITNSTACSTMLGYNTAYLRVNGDGSITFSNGACINSSGVGSFPSDRNLKENFTTVDSTDILNKIDNLPITEWNYKADPGVNYVGPVAQDFYSAFGLGGASTTIPDFEPGNIALVGVQALSQEFASSTASTTAAIDTLNKEVSNLIQMASSTNSIVINGTSSSSESNYASSTQIVIDSNDPVVLLNQAVSSMFNWIGQKIVAVSGFFGHLTVGSTQHPEGITLYDKVTGEPYCLGVANGVEVTSPGDCDTQDASTTPVTSTQTATVVNSGNTNQGGQNNSNNSGSSGSATSTDIAITNPDTTSTSTPDTTATSTPVTQISSASTTPDSTASSSSSNADTDASTNTANNSTDSTSNTTTTTPPASSDTSTSSGSDSSPVTITAPVTTPAPADAGAGTSASQ